MSDTVRDADKALVVAVAHHHSNAEHAAALTRFLRGAGAAVTDVDAPELDGVVVLLSRSALVDPHWMNEMVLRGRIIPVRIGRFDGLAVPKSLSELNYLDWPADGGDAVYGRVLAAIAMDPDRRDFLRRLTREAQAWQSAGHPDQLLIDDRGTGVKAVGSVLDTRQDPSAKIPDVTAAFVARSAVVLRKRRRAWWRKVAALTAAVVAVVAVSLWQIPALRLAGNNNRSAITTSGDPDVLASMPEWTAINNAAVLLNGSAAQRQLARASLRAAMAQPWSVSALQNIRAISTAVPFDGGRSAVVSFRWHGATQIAVVDVRTTRIAWRVSVPGDFSYVSVTTDGRTAIASGGSGLARIDLVTHAVRPAPIRRVFYGNVPVDADRTVALSTEGTGERLSVVDLADGAVARTAVYPAVLSLVAAGTGPVALVRSARGHLLLVDPRSARTLADTAGVPYRDGNGAVAPDGRRAAVEATDGQLWTFGVGEPPAPTGISVRFGHDSVMWASADRLVVSSSDHPAEVYDLGTGALLGRVCIDVNQPVEVRQAPGADVVSCVTDVGVSFYALPSGALPKRPSHGSRSLTASAAGTPVEAKGLRLRIGTESRVTSVAGKITAVAVSSDGTRLVVGGSLGDTAVLTVRNGTAVEVMQWRIPDRAAVTEVGWDGGGPFAVTATGTSWQVPDCAGCETDAGLLEAFRDRISGCFNARQIAWIDKPTQKNLRLRACDEPIGGE